MTFYFAYYGSKRLDIKHFDKFLNLDGIKTICEPFCGSSAVSFHAFKKIGYTGEYHLNDLDEKLIDFIRIVIDKKGVKYFNDIINNLPPVCGDKEEYKKRTEDPVYGFYYTNKIHGRYKGQSPIDSREQIDNVKSEKIDAFYITQKITLTNKSYIDMFEKYKDDPTAFLFLDPPYLDSYNALYSDFQNGETTCEKVIKDNTVMFIDIMEFLKVCKCRALLIINKNAITNYLYKDHILGEYAKTYSLTKKKTIHLIVGANIV